MANHGQLTFLSSQARTDFAAGLGRVHAEFVVVSWPTTLRDGSPSGDVETVYSWGNWLADSVYATPLTTWLAGRPHIPTFASSDGRSLFHDITKTASFGEDVVQMRFSNDSREIERLINVHGSGVKIEFFDFYPEVDSGTAISWFLGTLQSPTSHGDISKDFVHLTAASSIAPPDALVPHIAHPQQCPVRFGGQMTAAELAGHPCSYNQHLSGAEQTALGGVKGLLNGDGSAFPTCPHTEQGCLDRFGHKLVYMGVVPVTETVPVGAGEHKTYSTTHGRYGALLEPSSVIYGERDVTGVLLDFRREVNPSASHLDAGTLVTLFEFGLGPVQAMSEFQLMERTPQGIDYRLGTQEQTATVFSPLAPSLNRRAVGNLNHNPINPASVQIEQMKATCHMQGRNTVRVYSDQNTYVESYTNNRAWATLELIENTWFGLNVDRARYPVSDFIYLAGKNVSFNCQVTARTAPQQLTDIFESARWFPPFLYPDSTTGLSIWRFLPIEELDLGAGDIPTFTDAGANRNIVINNGISTVSPLPLNRAKIPNDVYLQFDDEDHANITRPLHFPDWTAQAEAGSIYGDNTKLLVPKTYTAYGITALSEVVPLGAFLRDLGPFGQGGLANALEVTFTTRPAIYYEAMELHLGKAIKVVSENLDPTIYLDPNGNAFEYFIITRLRRTSEADLEVTAIAYGKSYYDGACSPTSGYVTWPTPDSNVISGPNGANTKFQSVTGGTVSTSSVTWDTPIVLADVIVDRWVHTVDQLPTSGVFNITHPTGPIGFKLWSTGLCWLYWSGGIDATTLPAGSVGVGDTLGLEFDYNGGSPIRRYKHNGVTVLTDTTGVVADNAISVEVDGSIGDIIGDIYFETFPCTPTDEQEPGESGGTTGSTGSSGAEEAFDVLAHQVYERQTMNLEVEIFS